MAYTVERDKTQPPRPAKPEPKSKGMRKWRKWKECWVLFEDSIPVLDGTEQEMRSYCERLNNRKRT